MNNREKRQMLKKMGLLKAKKKLPLFQWAEEVRKNAEMGKQKQEMLKEDTRKIENESSDKKANDRISYIAIDLMINKKMDFSSAQAQAKILYEEEIRKTESNES